ncbi:MAG TPA: STAS domain-containing protein [Pseudonocardiaceae bacterium]|nr:STAS domain-containing protein [Pseudonocardiaceae bacterium]
MAPDNTPQPARDFLPDAPSPGHGNGDGSQLLGVTVVEQDHAVVVAHVAGEVDMLTAPLLQRHLNYALATQPQRLIVDLSRVRFLGSIGLAVLIDARTAATYQGTTLQLRSVSGAIARLLHVTGLASWFEIVPPEDGPGG